MSYNLWPNASFDREHLADLVGMSPIDWRKLYICEPAPPKVAWVIPHGCDLDGCEVFVSETRREGVYHVSGVRENRRERCRVRAEFLTDTPWWDTASLGVQR